MKYLVSILWLLIASVAVEAQPIKLSATTFFQTFGSDGSGDSMQTSKIPVGWAFNAPVDAVPTQTNITNTFAGSSLQSGLVAGAGSVAIESPSAGPIPGRSLIGEFVNNTGRDVKGIIVDYTTKGVIQKGQQPQLQYCLTSGIPAAGDWRNIAASAANTFAAGTNNKATTTAAALHNFTARINDVHIATGARFRLRWIVSGDSSLNTLLPISYCKLNLLTAPGPVVLSGFNAGKTGNICRVSWNTLQEEEVTTYHLQRQSAAGGEWQAIDSVAALGTSRSYLAYDMSPLAGSILYRLKIIRTDKSVSFSDTASVHFTTKYNLSVYPSPATSTLYIRSSGQVLNKALVTVQNANGQNVLVRSVQFTAETGSVDISSLKPGIYIIGIIDDDVVKTSLRFIKE